MSKSILELFDRVTVMEDLAEKLEKTKLKQCKLNMEENRVDITLACKEPIGREDILDYRDAVVNVYGLSDMNISFYSPNFNPNCEYIYGLVRLFVHRKTVCRPFLSCAKIEIDDKDIVISDIIGGEDILSRNRFCEFLRSEINRELGRDFDIKLAFREINPDDYISERDKKQQEITQKKISETPAKSATTEFKQGLLFGKPISEPPVSISSLALSPDGASPQTYVISGEVLSLDVRDIKPKNTRFGGGERKSITFAVGDSDWACSCNIFSDSDRLKRVTDNLKVGSLAKVSGTYEVDNYARKAIIKARSIELLPAPPMRDDTAEEKRVELHMHTKMSAMDGISSAKDIVKRAAKWGHKAVAITDHGVAQAFPEAHMAASGVGRDDFKVIYGMEGYLINDTDNASYCGKINRNDTFTVFDIETTGLKASECKITEIGAVKIENGEICEVYSQLIDPECHIPEEITKLTGISDDTVKGMPNIATVLPEFLDFVGDSTVVAHNASFDCGFIRYNANLLKLEFHNKILDTLRMSRELFATEKKHSLDVMCKRLGVSLENHHRASDDATATAKAFLKMLDICKSPNKTTDISKDPDMMKSLQRYHIILLAKNYVGLKNLYRLISASNLKYFYKRPLLPKSVIEQYRDGIILGSACEAGELYRAIIDGKSNDELSDIASFYDYLEIQPLCNNEFMLRNGTVTSKTELEDINKKIVTLGDRLNIPTVATCDVHFLDPSDAVYRKVLLGAQGFSDADEQPMLYFRTTDEMLNEFSYLGEEKAKEIVIENSNKIADLCEKIQPVKDGSYPPSIENCEEDLTKMCHEKAHRIYGDVLPKIVQERMDKELNSIIGNGYAVMYMIAHKLVKKSNEAGYLVGSRGSVGSSFAAFLSDITEVNALCPHYVCPSCKHSEWFDNGEYPTGIDMPDKDCPECGTKMKKDGIMIPFETFLGFKGDKVPDIDLNFSGEYQATAHKYVGELFGEEYVFKAGTIGTIADKTAIGFAKKYYEEKGFGEGGTAIPEEELLRISRGMVDVKRTTGQHPGGIIVCPKTMDIHDFCPVQHPADKKDSDIITTHFDFHSIHDNLLKLDILGHDDPSTIRMLEDLTGLNALELPLDDEKVMSLFSGTEALGVTPEQIGSKVGTFGVPEFGTSFVRGMLMETKPTTFVELLVISGLSHGTDVWLNNAQDLVKAKTATLAEVIGLRDDIMVYLIHHGLDPSMSFKIMEFVRKGKAAKEGMPEEYENAMKEHDVPDWYIESCKKIKYMFPKAHAAAYVMMALRIAYFKVYYPVEFYIAYFTVRADLFNAEIMTHGKERVKAEMQRINLLGNSASANDKALLTILEVCLEMYERGIEFIPADLYKSHATKFIKEDGKILPPFNAFEGVGESAAISIMNAAKDGNFVSQEDFKNKSGVSKAVLEVLDKNGVFKDLPQTSQMDFFSML